MQIIDAINNSEKPILSIEVLPPSRGETISHLLKTIASFQKYNLQFVNITNHQTAYKYIEIDDDIVKVPRNKKTGTIGVASAIKHKLNIEPVPHIICGGINKFVLEDLLIDLNYLEMENLFVVRGDKVPGTRDFIAEQDGFLHASEIVEQIHNLNNGIYTIPLKDPHKMNFGVGVAGYPEKHYEALNMTTDLNHLKDKVENGADYIITQMFFDASHYKNFVSRVREMGIDIPIIPGIKPIVRSKFLSLIPRSFYINIPQKLVSAFQETRTKKEEFRVGTKYVTEMVEELIDFGIPGIHIFTMGMGQSSNAILRNISANL